MIISVPWRLTLLKLHMIWIIFVVTTHVISIATAELVEHHLALSTSTNRFLPQLLVVKITSEFF